MATVSSVLSAYKKYRSPRKSERERRSDNRRAEMWERVLGPGCDAHAVSMAAWERFIDARLSGSIDARGREVPADARRPVGPRTVEADCQWLRWVFNWATRWRAESGDFLIQENPVRGYEAPRERNPRRPTATQDRFEAVRAVSDLVETETRWGKCARRRSYRRRLSFELSEVGQVLLASG